MLLPLPKALDVAVPGRRHHHQPLGRVLEHQHAQLPRVGQQQFKVHLRQELVIQDAWGRVGGQEVRGAAVAMAPPLWAASPLGQQATVLRTDSLRITVDNLNTRGIQTFEKTTEYHKKKPCKPTRGDDWISLPPTLTWLV